MKVITNPDAFQLLADETRRRIIYLLRAKEMTVAQIAESLKLTPQAIYHHIRKLKDSDMVEVAREERVDHFIETYYRATAEIFSLAHGTSGGSATAEPEIRECMDALPKLGLKAKITPTVLSKTVQLMTEIMKPESESPWTEKINQLEDVSFLGKQTLVEVVYLMTTSDADFEDFLKKYRELRKTLHSALLEPVAVAKKA